MATWYELDDTITLSKCHDTVVSQVQVAVSISITTSGFLFGFVWSLSNLTVAMCLQDLIRYLYGRSLVSPQYMAICLWCPVWMYLPHLIQPQLQQYDEYFSSIVSDAWPFNSLMYLILPQYRHNMMQSLIHSYWYMASQQPNKGVTDRYSIWPSDDGLAETITLSKHHRELVS